jgi:hypothetical protein
MERALTDTADPWPQTKERVVNKYEVSKFFAWALTGSVAAMLVAGVLLWRSDFLPATLNAGPFLKAVCVAAFALAGASAMGAANCMASHAQVAWKHGRRYLHVAIPATFFAVGFALTGAVGVHIGWEVLTKPDMSEMALPPGALVVACAVFVAMGKMSSNWIISGRESIDKDEAKEEDERVRRETEAKESLVRAETDARRGFSVMDGGKAAAMGMLALGLGAGALPPQADAAPVGIEQSAVVDVAKLPQERREEMARQMFEQGAQIRPTMRACHLTYHRARAIFYAHVDAQVEAERIAEGDDLAATPLEQSVLDLKDMIGDVPLGGEGDTRIRVRA